MYIIFNNPELETLITTGESTTYKALYGERAFLQSLHAFLTVLHIMKRTDELSFYKQFHYTKNASCSQVLIDGSKLQGKLLFSELDEGKRIIIKDLIF